MTYGAPNFADVPKRICPRHQVIVLTPKSLDFPADWEVVLTEEEKRAAARRFETRLPPVTDADHIAVGLAVNAQKPTDGWKALPDYFALCQEVQRSGGAL